MIINKCKVCFKEFESEKGLRNHIFHSKLDDEKHLEQKIELREKKYKNAKKECSVCGQKIFRNMGIHLTRNKDNKHTVFYKNQSNFIINLFKNHKSFKDISKLKNLFCKDFSPKHFSKICVEHLGKRKTLEISKEIFSIKRKNYWKLMNPEKRSKIMEKVREAEWNNLTQEQRKKHPWVLAGKKASLKSSKRGSKNQRYAFKILKQEFPDLDFKYNHVIEKDWHIDIALPEKSLYIEWDGRHHFVPIHGQSYLNNRKNRDKVKDKFVVDKLNGCMIRIRDHGRENKEFVEFKMNKLFRIMRNKIPLGEVIRL